MKIPTEACGAAAAAFSYLRALTVDYEALVADLEGESRQLISFLGLDWEPACLDFHKTERPVLTASAWQVRQQNGSEAACSRNVNAATAKIEWS